MRLVAIIVIIITSFAFADAIADIYRYVDKGGQLHYVDDFQKVPLQYRDQIDKLNSLPDVNIVDPGPAAQIRKSEPEQPGKPTVASPRATVDVYVTSWCGYCKKMERFLSEKGIPYTRHDIEKDEAAATEYRLLGARGVPVVRIGDYVVHGYNPEAVMSYLNGPTQ